MSKRARDSIYADLLARLKDEGRDDLATWARTQGKRWVENKIRELVWWDRLRMDRVEDTPPGAILSAYEMGDKEISMWEKVGYDWVLERSLGQG